MAKGGVVPRVALGISETGGTFVWMGRGWKVCDTYREHPEERCLARILQADHGDVHLCCPAVCQLNSRTPVRLQWDLPMQTSRGDLPTRGRTLPYTSCRPEAHRIRRLLTYQKVRNSQSYTFFTSCAIICYACLFVRYSGT